LKIQIFQKPPTQTGPVFIYPARMLKLVNGSHIPFQTVMNDKIPAFMIANNHCNLGRVERIGTWMAGFGIEQKSLDIFIFSS
jgi:hypothetical protein